MSTVETLTQMPPELRLPIDALRPHGMNLRRDLGDLSTLTASIKAKDVLAPITVAPATEPGQYVILAGHRRVAAAKKAGLDTVPATIRHDLTDEADQIAVMLTENRDRAGLTADEEAAGVEYMLDLGESVKTISRRVGWSATKVKARAKIARLDAEVRAQIHQHQLTIADAVAIADADPEDREELQAAAGTPDWEVVKVRIQRAAARRRLAATQAKKAQALGFGEYWFGSALYAARHGGFRKVEEETGRKTTGLEEKDWDPDLAASIADDPDRFAVYAITGDHDAPVKLIVYRLGDTLPPAEDPADDTDSGPGTSGAQTAEDQEAADRADEEERAAQQLQDELDAAAEVRLAFLRNLPPAQFRPHLAGIIADLDRANSFCPIFRRDMFPDAAGIDADTDEDAMAQWISGAALDQLLWTSTVGDLNRFLARWFTRFAMVNSWAADEAILYASILARVGYQMSSVETRLVDHYLQTWSTRGEDTLP
ncbi:MAG: ParB/RepB/Spo0J family partition protein [Gordonia sp. (in: high G+C Gram-positive bacteria)]